MIARDVDQSYALPAWNAAVTPSGRPGAWYAATRHRARSQSALGLERAMVDDQPTIRVSLALTWGTKGEAEINEALQTACDRFHVAGEPMGSSALSYPANEWILDHPPMPAVDADDCVEEFMDRIRPLAPRIAALDDVEAGISIVTHGESRVGVFLSEDTIALIAQIGASLDIESLFA